MITHGYLPCNNYYEIDYCWYLINILEALEQITIVIYLCEV